MYTNHRFCNCLRNSEFNQYSAPIALNQGGATAPRKETQEASKPKMEKAKLRLII